MYTALLFLFAIGAVLALDDFEAMKKQLNTNYNSLDRLTARIQNLKDLVEKKLATKREADRKSKNMLLRLDRMNLDDDRGFKCRTAADGRQINFKCSTRQQCVGNILVCDNVADCEDGSDEDKDFCRIPFTEGVQWGGHNVFYNCTPGTETNNFMATFDVTSMKRNDVYPSLVNVETFLLWNFGKEQIKTNRESAVYHFSNQYLKYKELAYEGSIMHFGIKFLPGGQSGIFETFRPNDLRPCERIIFMENKVMDFDSYTE